MASAHDRTGKLEKVIDVKDEKKELEGKLKTAVDDAMHKVMGVTIDELSKDISEKLKKSPIIDFEIDIKPGFRKAKKNFIRRYVEKLLLINYGNISEVAKIAGLDRRSVHRLVKGSRINVEKIRSDMTKAYDVKQSAVNAVIEDVLDDYKAVIHPVKLTEMYRNVPEFSKDIIEALPEKQPSLKEAEEEFEKEFIRKAMKENNNNITKTSKRIGLRYETLQRKIKRYGLSMRL